MRVNCYIVAINYYYLWDSYNGNLPRPSLERPRVFISHQKRDSEAAKVVADYLQDAGIDVYFDQYDSSINRSDPQSVVNAIKRGIENSTHMLVLFSPNTFDSMWVPWEIGYAYNSVATLNVVRLKGVENGNLPEYLKVVKTVMSIYQLNSLIASIKNINRAQLILENTSFSENNPTHMLNNIMYLYE